MAGILVAVKGIRKRRQSVGGVFLGTLVLEIGLVGRWQIGKLAWILTRRYRWTSAVAHRAEYGINIDEQKKISDSIVSFLLVLHISCFSTTGACRFKLRTSYSMKDPCGRRSK